MLEQTRLFVLLHDVRVADIEGFEVFAVALRIAVHVVAAEEFVCALAGITELCMLRRCKAAERKDDRGSVTERLLHVVHDIRYDIEILLRGDLCNGMLHTEQLRCFGSNARFVEAFLVIAAGICTLCIGHRQHIRGIDAAGQE